MSIPREYRAARKKFARWLPVGKRARRAKRQLPPVFPSQRTILDFLPPRNFPRCPACHTLGGSGAYPRRLSKTLPRASSRTWSGTCSKPSPRLTGSSTTYSSSTTLPSLTAQDEPGRGRGEFQGCVPLRRGGVRAPPAAARFRDFTGIEKVAQFVGGNPLVGVLRDDSVLSQLREHQLHPQAGPREVFHGLFPPARARRT